MAAEETPSLAVPQGNDVFASDGSLTDLEPEQPAADVKMTA